MKTTREIPLEHGGFYHIYNRGNNGESLFYTAENYAHFLRLYDKYIEPVADTYAWCLMGNHFHLLVRIKEVEEIGFLFDLNASRSSDSGRLNQSERLKWKTSINLPESEGSGRVMNRKKPIPYRMFSHLFNSYTKYLNLKIGRTGSLFEKNFHRIPINSDRYFQNLVVYIHQNPVHHGFTDDFRDYPWSSYGSFISEKVTKIKRNEVLGWFDGRENFICTHKSIVEDQLIEHLTVSS